MFLNVLNDSKYYVLNDLEHQEINHKVEGFLKKYKDYKFVFIDLFIQDFKKYFTLDTRDISFDIDRTSIHNEKLTKFVKRKNYQTIANLTKALICNNGNGYVLPGYKNEKDIENILYFDSDNIRKRNTKTFIKKSKR